MQAAGRHLRGSGTEQGGPSCYKQRQPRIRHSRWSHAGPARQSAACSISRSWAQNPEEPGDVGDLVGHHSGLLHQAILLLATLEAVKHRV